MQGWAEKYNIELGGLGQTFQQQKLTATATEIITAFDGLVHNGADFNVVLHGMTDEINEVVQNSLKFGTEIPGNMQPWIASLIASGGLLGLNKERILDIDTLKFGPNVKSDVDKLVEAIRDLIAKIGTGLPAAIGNLASVRVPSIRIPIEYDDPGFTGGRVAIPQATGGDWWVTRPTLFMAGEAGPERATFTPAGSSRSGQATTTKLYVTTLDGRLLMEAIAEEVYA
jgi:hypothetical protein